MSSVLLRVDPGHDTLLKFVGLGVQDSRLSSIDHLVTVHEKSVPVVFCNCDVVHLQAAVALLPGQGKVFCWVGEVVVE